MTTLTNEITIDASADRVWAVLTSLPELADYDPAVRDATVTSPVETGSGASRRVGMKDGRHWFEEQITVFRANTELTFQLTACNFPIATLQHTYALAETAGRTTVSQVMSYQPKFGPLGRLLDTVLLRRNFDSGVKTFLAALKTHTETGTEPPPS